MLIDRSVIRVKAMLVAPDAGGATHAVTLNPPTAENPAGYHRLIGGSVELGETHREAIIREVDEELGATICDLRLVTCVENIFRIDGEVGHEIVFVYLGRLDPEPSRAGAMLTESDGSTVPVVWRRFDDAEESIPLYPAGVAPWLRPGVLSRIASDRADQPLLGHGGHEGAVAGEDAAEREAAGPAGGG